MAARKTGRGVRSKGARKRATRGSAKRKRATAKSGTKRRAGSAKKRPVKRKRATAKRGTKRSGVSRRKPAGKKRTTRARPKSGAATSRKKSAPTRRSAARSKASTKQARPVRRTLPNARRSRVVQETLIEVGRVMHFFAIPNAAAIEVSGEGLVLGDQIRIKGHTTDIRQHVTSMQIEHRPIDRARRGDIIGLHVDVRVREQDIVFKVAGPR